MTSSRGRDVGRGIHAHVERRVGRVGEPALGAVELHRGDAEVEQDRVGAHAVLGELREDDREVAAQEARVHAGGAAEALEVRAHGRIAVDRDHLAVAVEVAREERSVPAGAEGRVDERLPGLEREQLAHLVRENGNVVSRVGLQDVRQHALHLP